MYWFKNYQIDNTVTVSDNTIKLTSSFNDQIMSKFLFGNRSTVESDIRDMYGQEKKYEIAS